MEEVLRKSGAIETEECGERGVREQPKVIDSNCAMEQAWFGWAWFGAFNPPTLITLRVQQGWLTFFVKSYH
jgi:hypothetical protein